MVYLEQTGYITLCQFLCSLPGAVQLPLWTGNSPAARRRPAAGRSCCVAEASDKDAVVAFAGARVSSAPLSSLLPRSKHLELGLLGPTGLYLMT